MTGRVVGFITGDERFEVHVEVDEDGDFEITEIDMQSPDCPMVWIGLASRTGPFERKLYNMVAFEALNSAAFATEARAV